MVKDTFKGKSGTQAINLFLKMIKGKDGEKSVKLAQELKTEAWRVHEYRKVLTICERLSKRKEGKNTIYELLNSSPVTADEYKAAHAATETLTKIKKKSKFQSVSKKESLGRGVMDFPLNLGAKSSKITLVIGSIDEVIEFYKGIN